VSTAQSSPSQASVQVLSERTLRTYAADWALFEDWCDATDQQPLPADPGTVLGFLAGCPAKISTQRVRVTAIDHRHAGTGYARPGQDPVVLAALGRPVPGPFEPSPESVAAVESALRMLPSHGWTNGMFGRRDRCLLVLSQLAGVPYRHLAELTVGDLTLTQDGTVTITTGGRAVLPGEDAVVCGPCAVIRWLEVLDIAVRKISTSAVAYLVGNADPVTADSPHPCRSTLTLDPATLSVPLLPPINQWGALPYPHPGLTPHAHSHHTRNLLHGDIRMHRDLPYPTDDDPIDQPPRTPATPEGAAYDKAARDRAWVKRRQDLNHLADVADTLSDLDRQIVELERRVTTLLVNETI
jgi:hypothetical protein